MSNVFSKALTRRAFLRQGRIFFLRPKLNTAAPASYSPPLDGQPESPEVLRPDQKRVVDELANFLVSYFGQHQMRRRWRQRRSVVGLNNDNPEFFFEGVEVGLSPSALAVVDFWVRKTWGKHATLLSVLKVQNLGHGFLEECFSSLFPEEWQFYEARYSTEPTHSTPEDQAMLRLVLADLKMGLSLQGFSDEMSESARELLLRQYTKKWEEKQTELEKLDDRLRSRTLIDLRRLAAHMQRRTKSSERRENRGSSEETDPKPQSTELVSWPLPPSGLEWMVAGSEDGRIALAWVDKCEPDAEVRSISLFPESPWQRETVRAYSQYILQLKKRCPEGEFLAIARDQSGRIKTASLSDYGYFVPSPREREKAEALLTD